MSNGKSIRMFLADGTPGGIITAEIMNWTGHVVTAPRSRLADLLRRPELVRTGVYILIGDDTENIDRSLIYIGESDNVGTRLTRHACEEDNGGKDFWNRVVVITSKDSNLTKGHVWHLESKMVEIATAEARVGLINRRAPEPCALPEADCADMAFFIDQVRIILPVLGFDFLRERNVITAARANQITPQPTISPRFELNSPRHSIRAEAQEIDGEFIVLCGSQARAQWTGGAHTYQTLHQGLIRDNKLIPHPGSDHLTFNEDTIFNSPSAASAVILGRPDNGRKTWTIAGSGQSYAAWQESQMPTLPAEE